MSILTCRARSPTPLRSTQRSRRCSCPPALARGLPAGTLGSGEKPLQWETQSSADLPCCADSSIGRRAADIGFRGLASIEWCRSQADRAKTPRRVIAQPEFRGLWASRAEKIAKFHSPRGRKEHPIEFSHGLLVFCTKRERPLCAKQRSFADSVAN